MEEELNLQPILNTENEEHAGGYVEGIYERLKAEIGKAIVGQETMVQQIIIGFLARGHILLEGVPGTAKTLLVRSLSRSLNLTFTRIQFTPDLMPSDIIGTRVFDPKTVEFVVRRGPLFANFILADEINRTPAKTQAALLEAMEEGNVTIDGEPHSLPVPFFVAATQNPIEFEGTYPLPEAQLDRFMMKVLVDYPSSEDETCLLSRYQSGFRSQNLETAGLASVLSPEELQQCFDEVDRVRVELPIIQYIARIVRETRTHRQITLGASPRAGVALLLTAKAMAAIQGRDFVTPDEVKSLVHAVLRHRIILRPESEIEGQTPDRIIQAILDSVEVPR
ncbi:MAG: MoxR family ATPase [Armatimonadetes bacterium]|nr:MoxR family ATPase [Armatimonadota bacterium]